MSALVVPFPRSRDREFVARHASIMAAASTKCLSQNSRSPPRLAVAATLRREFCEVH